MSKFLSILVAALLSCIAFNTQAAEENVRQFLDKEKYVVVATHFNAGSAALKILNDVAEALIRAGYKPRDETKSLSVGDQNTWCMVDIKPTITDRVYCRCYSRNEYPGLIVQDLVWTTGDVYNNVAPTLARLYEQHQRATKALSQGQTKVLFVPTF